MRAAPAGEQDAGGSRAQDCSVPALHPPSDTARPDSAGSALIRRLAEAPLSSRGATLLGAALGAVIFVGTSVLLMARVRQSLEGLDALGDAFVPRYVARQLVPIAVLYVGLGALLALAIRGASRRRSLPALLVATGGGWAALLAACVVASPAVLARVGPLLDVPFGVTLAAAMLAVAVGGVAGRVRWWAYAGALGLAVSPILAPRPGLSVPRAEGGRPGSVLLLGVDNLRRAGMEQLAAAYVARGGDPDGVRVLSDAVSPVPVTRTVWQSIVGQRRAIDAVAMDTLTPAAWRAHVARGGDALTAGARRAGARSTFITDDANTLVFSPAEAFDAVRQDASGWQVDVAKRLQRAFPVYAGYVSRWTGVGIANTPGTTDSRRALRAAVDELRRAAPRPALVGAHVVSLHGEIEPSTRELGGLARLATLRPRDLLTHKVADWARRETATQGSPASQRVLHQVRAAATIDDVVELLLGLDRGGYREHDLIVVFSDHGDFFPETGVNIADLHGMQLEPGSSQVGVLVLLPRATHGGHARVPGTFPIRRVGELALAHLGRDVAPAAQVALLDSVAQGLPFATRAVPARSYARLDVGVQEASAGRRVFSWNDVGRGFTLWPDGRVSITPAAYRRMTETADFGYTDGERLVACSPMADGTLLIQRYEHERLVGTHRVPARGRPGVNGCEQLAGGPASTLLAALAAPDAGVVPEPRSARRASPTRAPARRVAPASVVLVADVHDAAR